jgi:GT2 family glycosyltransferase
VGVVTGRSRPASLARPSERWFEASFSFDRGTAPQRYTVVDRGRQWFPAYPGGVGSGCNMAFRRDLFRARLHFDEVLDMGTAIGGGGDIDIFAQALDADQVIVYVPEALVWHHHRTTERDLRRQMFGYGVAIGAVATKFARQRRGHQRAAMRFYRSWLRERRRQYRMAQSGYDSFPPDLLRAQIRGQLAGPFVYTMSRFWAARRQAN